MVENTIFTQIIKVMLQFTYTPAVAMRSRPDRRKGDPAMDGGKLERGGPGPNE